jgi:hypothetical protein
VQDCRVRTEHRRSPKLIIFLCATNKLKPLIFGKSTMCGRIQYGTSMKQTIYYLPGHGGLITTGLGQALLSRGYGVTGRETVGEFKNIGFQNQVKTIAADLREHFWSEDARVIANSFGAYLFLHAQVLLGEPYIGNVILLSPIVGEFSNEETLMNFIPPQAGKLLELAKTGSFPAPLNCEMHTGSDDWQSHPKNVIAFGEMVGIKAYVVDGAGHTLPKNYVSDRLDRWL